MEPEDLDPMPQILFSWSQLDDCNMSVDFSISLFCGAREGRAVHHHSPFKIPMNKPKKILGYELNASSKIKTMFFEIFFFLSISS